MPRGVYSRKSASKANAKTPAVKAKALQVLTAQPAAIVPPAAPIQKPSPRLKEVGPIRGSVDDMKGARLKAYAKQVGVMQRDIDGLTEDRLRQNCKAMIFAGIEED